MSKVIRNAKTDNTFKMREFATVERGESVYNLRSFSDDEELSVQDMFSDTGEDEPDTIEQYQDEITDRDYWPPSRLAKAEEDVAMETVNMPSGKIGQGFVESPMFSDNASFAEAKVIKSRNNDNPEDDLPPEDVPVAAGEFSADIPEADSEDGEFIQIAEMSPVIDDKELQELKNKLAAIQGDLEEAKNYAEESNSLKLTVEKALMERDKQLEAKTSEFDALNESLPEKLETAKEEGRQAGYEAAKTEFEKSYEAEKNDYMEKLDNFMKEALSKLDAIKSSIDALDDEIPATVLGFVKTLIGEERKLNDAFALNLIKQNLSRLNEFRDISFSVNPDDEETVRQGLPDYKVTGDMSVPKGCVAVHAKSGEITLDSDNMIADLEKQINAQFTASKDG